MAEPSFVQKEVIPESVANSIVWGIVAVIALISIPWSISYYYSSVHRAAMEAGLHQQTVPGKSGVYWVMPESAER